MDPVFAIIDGSFSTFRRVHGDHRTDDFSFTLLLEPRMKRKSHGFTLVELLVVITIIGILMGLLIPAVNAARETARRNQCAANIKNFALAAVQYENQKGNLPPWVAKYGFFDPSGTGAGGTDPTDLGNFSGTVPAHVKVGGFGIALLPWLDGQPTFEHWTQDRYPVINDGSGDLEGSRGLSGQDFHELAAPNLGIFQCPSNPVSQGSHGKNSYVPNNGMSHIFTTRGHNSSNPGTLVHTYLGSQQKANGCFTSQYRGLDTMGNLLPTADPPSLDDLKDGQGFTILFAENVQAAPWHRPGFLDAAGLLVSGAGIEDIANTTLLDYSRYTNGLVWHYEDDKATQLNSIAPTPPTSPAGTSVFEVFRQHKINGGGDDISEDIFVLKMSDNSWDAPSLARPSSAHVEGVNCGFADGQTRFLNAGVDYRVYQALLTPRGKSSDVPWKEFVLTDELGE
jgi:prepilin-type N-terminal cleavage/methylation domain-containing protein